MNKKELENKIHTLSKIAKDLHWMARRYADGRQSYATSMFNDHTRKLLSMGIELNPTGDGTIWARDSMGRNYDHLTDEEAALGDEVGFYAAREVEEITFLREQIEKLRQDIAQLKQPEVE